jgi:hypothetical protein
MGPYYLTALFQLLGPVTSVAAWGAPLPYPQIRSGLGQATAFSVRVDTQSARCCASPPAAGSRPSR